MLTAVAEFLIFILQWFIGWLIESPHVLLILLLLGGATIGTWKLLNQMTMPAFLSSPKTSLLLLVGLFIVTMRGYNTNQRLLGLNSDLANAEWRIRQGSQYRIHLLNQIELAGMTRKNQPVKEESLGEREENALDGCLHVFLTAGTSNTRTIRQLYEPSNFPQSSIQSVYEKLFGTPEERNKKEICLVSFAPNADLVKEEQALSHSYSPCGIRVIVLDAEVVRIAQYITSVVAERKLPDSASTTSPQVGMLLGGPVSAHLKVIPDMLVSGALGIVHTLVLEGGGDSAHREMVESIVALGELTSSEGMEHSFEVLELEDTPDTEHQGGPVSAC